MKHYRIFGSSLRSGIIKVSYSDLMVELIGILVHALALSPQASEILQIMSQASQNYPSDGTGTTPPPFAILDQLMNNTCIFNGTSTIAGTGFVANGCIYGISFGAAGIIIHLIEIVAMFFVLKLGQQTDPNKLELWIKLTGVLTILDVLVFIGSIVFRLDPKLIAYTLSNLIYKIYSCGLVKAYSTEQRRAGETAVLTRAGGESKNSRVE